VDSTADFSIFGVVSYFPLYDWPGENHYGEITGLFGSPERFFLTQKTKNKTEKS